MEGEKLSRFYPETKKKKQFEVCDRQTVNC